MQQLSVSKKAGQPTKTLVNVLLHHATETPHHCFLHWVDKNGGETASLTYEMLWKQALHVAHLIKSAGLQTGDRVMLVYLPGVEYLPALIGSMLAGVIACSVYPPSPFNWKKDFERFLRQAEDAQAKFALTSDVFKKGMDVRTFLGKRGSLEWLVTDKPTLNEATFEANLNALSPEDIAFIQYTSGSTGTPKGVCITHKCLSVNLDEIMKLWCGATGVEPFSVDAPRATKIRGVFWLPQYHDFGLIAGFLGSAYAGLETWCFSPLDFIQKPLLWHTLVTQHKAELTGAPNFAYGLLAKRLESWKRHTPTTDWAHVKSVCIGAEPVDPLTIEQIQGIIGAPRSSIQPGYGMAEVGLFVSLGSTEIYKGRVSCAKSLDSEGFVSVRLVVDGKKVMADSEEGEIWVRSESAALGYWRKGELTKATFYNTLEGEDGNWIATGDLGLVHDGQLYVTGRKKEIIIINGRNYYPTDIERVVQEEYPDVVRPGCSAAFQFTSGSAGLVLEVRDGTPKEAVPPIAKLKRKVMAETGVGLVYVCVLTHHTVPKTTSGKIKRTEAKNLSLNGKWEKRSIVAMWIGEEEHKQEPLADWESAAPPSGIPGADMEGTSVETRLLLIAQRVVGEPLQLTDVIGELGLGSMEISALHESIKEGFMLEDPAELSVTWYMGSTASIAELATVIEREQSLAQSNHTNRRFEQSPLNTKGTHRRAFNVPVLVGLVGTVLQLVGLMVPALYLGASLTPLFYVLSLSPSILVSFLVSPLLAVLMTFSSSILLVAIKWAVLGKLRPGQTFVWSTKFAQRWIVRQCCRTCFHYTPWRFMNSTALLNMLLRSLGCRIGAGVSINYDCVDDFDLVSVGAGSSIDGYVDPSNVSGGVLTLRPIIIGSNCVLGNDCLVEMGCTVEDLVVVGVRSLVVANSVLGTQSVWEGKPAIRVSSPTDIESNPLHEVGAETSALAQGTDLEQPTIACGVWRDEEKGTPQGEPRQPSILFLSCQFVTLFMISPCLSGAEIILAIQIGTLLITRVGLLWTAILVWVPFTCSFLVATFITIAAKEAMLGRVRPGKWPLYGSFHCRKYIVDHLVDAHLLVWRDFAGLVGSPLVHSTFLGQELWMALGGKVGRHSIANYAEIWKSYGLVNIGDHNVWGGGSRCLPWSTENGYLVAKAITSGNQCYVGANSTIKGGVTLKENATVAGYSVASGDVEGNQTVVGMQVVTANLDTKTSSKASMWEMELASHVTGVWLWAIASLVVFGIKVVVEQSSLSTVDSSFSTLDLLWLRLSFLLGTISTLVLPLYCLLVALIGKHALYGVFQTEEIKRGTMRSILFIAQNNIAGACMDVVRSAIGGTFIEVLLYKLMGATIGTNVYLDSVYMYEPDLVTVGDSSSIGRGATLSPHQMTRATIQTAKLRIGDRCSVGASTSLHGRDIVECDTTLSGKTMGLIGTRMRSGNWSGYPAKRTGPAFQPTRPSLPAWYVILFHPFSILYGAFWWLLLQIDGVVSRDYAYTKLHVNSFSMPAHLRGLFTLPNLPQKVRLDAGHWSQNLRMLKLDAGSYVAADEKFPGFSWCRWATYRLDFDDKLNEAVGQVSFGWWHVPRSIVSVYMKRQNDGWTIGHGWFHGAPTSEISLTLTRDSPPRPSFA